MKTKTALKYLSIVALVTVALTWPLVKARSTELEDVAAREAYRRLQLQDENGEIPPDGWINAYAQKEAMRFLPEAWSEFSSAAQIEAGILGGVWSSIGPGNIGGRIRSIIIKPTTCTTCYRTMWVGSVGGGVWKTVNSGVTWFTTTDSLSNLAVNCMAIDPANPLILYAGTGEGFGNLDAIPGNGIFKTTDGGASWLPLSSTVGTLTNHDFLWVNRLAIAPTNSQLLLAAVRIYPPAGGAPFGKILRSTDGGGSWTTRLTLSAPLTDVRFRPTVSQGGEDPGVPAINCLAGSLDGDLYYSTDFGGTWATYAGNGLPTPTLLQRVELAYSRSNPSIVYASKAAVSAENSAKLYRSLNGGYTFQPTADSFPPFFRDHGADWYKNVLWVDPTPQSNSNTVLVGGEYLHRSTDGGATWDEASSNDIHPDHHVIVEDPLYGGAGSGNTIVYGGNDGGIHRTPNIFGPGSSVIWTALNHRLGITQFYGAAGNVATGTIIGGTQDNGTVRLRPPPYGPEDWDTMYGGDGGFCAVDQQPVTPPRYFYGEYLYLNIYRNETGGPSPTPQPIWGGDGHPNGIPRDCNGNPCANYTAPFVLDPNNALEEHRMLAGGRSLWRSTNARAANAVDVAWPPIKEPMGGAGNNINAIAVAEGDSNLIWVGYNDGSVSYTTNGNPGPSASPMPSWSPGDPTNRLPGGQPSIDERMCTRITIGPAPEATPQIAITRTIYVTFGGFFPSLLDSRGNVWKRENDGVTWTDIHHNLPSTPIYSLVISPTNPDILYVGTEVGIFASKNGGATWSPAFGGSADSPVYSFVISPSNATIVYVGTGLGVFASADDGATWVPGFAGPANTRVAELFWMGPKLVVATHGRGMYTLSPPSP